VQSPSKIRNTHWKGIEKAAGAGKRDREGEGAAMSNGCCGPDEMVNQSNAQLQSTLLERLQGRERQRRVSRSRIE